MASADFSFLAYAGSCFTVAGGVWLLFDRLEATARPEAKARAAQWLKNVKLPPGVSNWPAIFAAGFDRVFGERHLSWQCFRRSCLASLAALVVAFSIWVALNPGRTVAWWRFHTVWSAGALAVTPLLVLAFSLIPDYVSLLETRFVLRLMSRTASSLARIALLLLDALATAVIALAGFILLFVISELVDIVRGESHAGFASMLRAVRAVVQGVPGLWLGIGPLGGPPAGLLFYAAFVTSVWAWLYAISGFTVKLLVRAGAWAGLVRSILDIDAKPFQSIGYVAMILVVLAFVVAYPFAG